MLRLDMVEATHVVIQHDPSTIIGSMVATDAMALDASILDTLAAASVAIRDVWALGILCNGTGCVNPGYAGIGIGCDSGRMGFGSTLSGCATYGIAVPPPVPPPPLQNICC
ncbi:unnamed protein product [Strongylus vulgaris]|uniref:Uncharacterized protein n=1 Tax=Strongylus vulgaris TaxID=40348 RepID=A0A3P7JEM6_STRVU|nr:unnamed protein product [Strongylus vulgaris]